MSYLLAALPSLSQLFTGWRLATSIAGILALAVVAGRLLGTRRSLGTALTAGAVGWVTGAALAVLLAGTHEHGQSGFLRGFAGFSQRSSPCRPPCGSRCSPSRGPSPAPSTACRRSRTRSGRRGGEVPVSPAMRRSRDSPPGTGSADPSASSTTETRWPATHSPRSRAAGAQGCRRNVVKLGQVLSTRWDLMPEDFLRELTRLQDHAAPAPRVAVEQLLVEDLGRPHGELFETFDWEPIAAASIGQAYRARLRSGEDVIVKVQRPGVAQAVERDLDVLAQLGHALEAPPPGPSSTGCLRSWASSPTGSARSSTSASSARTRARSPPIWRTWLRYECRRCSRSCRRRGCS